MQKLEKEILITNLSYKAPPIIICLIFQTNNSQFCALPILLTRHALLYKNNVEFIIYYNK